MHQHDQGNLNKVSPKRYSSSGAAPVQPLQEPCKQSHLYGSTTGAAPTEKMHTYDEFIPEAEKNGGQREDVPSSGASAAAGGMKAKRLGILGTRGEWRRKGIVKLWDLGLSVFAHGFYTLRIWAHLSL